MAALKASRWVWPAMSLMVSMISWISIDDCWIAPIASRERFSRRAPSAACSCVCVAMRLECSELSAMLPTDWPSWSSTDVMALTLLMMRCSRATWSLMSMANLITL